MRLEVEDAKVRLLGLPLPPQNLGDVDHAERQIGGIGDGRLFDIHEILEAPVLLGVPEVELDLEAQGVVVDDLIIGLVAITAEQNGMGAGACLAVGLNDDHNVQRLGKEFMQGAELVDLGANTLLGRRTLALGRRQLGIVDFVTVLLVGATSAVRAIIQEVQGGIDRQLGDQVVVAAPHHLQGIVVAEGTVQHDICDDQRRPDTALTACSKVKMKLK